VRFRIRERFLGVNVAVGRWSSPAVCFHSADSSLADSYRRPSLTPPFASSSKTLWVLRGPSSVAASCLSSRAPLIGFSQRPPLRRISLCVHSRRTEVWVYHFPNTFRPCRSSRLRRFAPHRALRVCCTPLPTMRSAWFCAES